MHASSKTRLVTCCVAIVVIEDPESVPKYLLISPYLPAFLPTYLPTYIGTYLSHSCMFVRCTSTNLPALVGHTHLPTTFIQSSNLPRISRSHREIRRMTLAPTAKVPPLAAVVLPVEVADKLLLLPPRMARSNSFMVNLVVYGNGP